jgi:hypothetical protein
MWKIDGKFTDAEKTQKGNYIQQRSSYFPKKEEWVFRIGSDEVKI